jgi:septal ring factor EnvC (AmiA/AmiB activator)
LASLNKKLNAGATLTSLRNDFARLEKSIAEKEATVATLKNELVFFNDLYNKGAACFAFGELNQANLALLAEHEVTAENYHRIQNVIDENNRKIAEIESALPQLRCELRDTVDTLDTLERVMGKTFVQGLVDEHKPRLQADFVPNGLRVAKL